MSDRKLDKQIRYLARILSEHMETETDLKNKTLTITITNVRDVKIEEDEDKRGIEIRYNRGREFYDYGDDVHEEYDAYNYGSLNVEENKKDGTVNIRTNSTTKIIDPSNNIIAENGYNVNALLKGCVKSIEHDKNLKEAKLVLYIEGLENIEINRERRL